MRCLHIITVWNLKLLNSVGFVKWLTLRLKKSVSPANCKPFPGDVCVCAADAYRMSNSGLQFKQVSI